MTTDSQPTPEQIAHDVMRTIDGAKYHDIDTPDVIAILAALRDAGYAPRFLAEILLAAADAAERGESYDLRRIAYEIHGAIDRGES